MGKKNRKKKKNTGFSNSPKKQVLTESESNVVSADEENHNEEKLLTENKKELNLINNQKVNGISYEGMELKIKLEEKREKRRNKKKFKKIKKKNQEAVARGEPVFQLVFNPPKKISSKYSSSKEEEIQSSQEEGIQSSQEQVIQSSKVQVIQSSQEEGIQSSQEEEIQSSKVQVIQTSKTEKIIQNGDKKSTFESQIIEINDSDEEKESFDKLKKEQRKKRFATETLELYSLNSVNKRLKVGIQKENVLNVEHTNLEKKYFRNADVTNINLRSESVLKDALELVKKKWIQSRNYEHASEQLRCIRQELLTQGIRNEFTLTVYQIHYRIALEMKDLTELNCCQTQIFQLFDAGIELRKEEFLAYQLLNFASQHNAQGLAAFWQRVKAEEWNLPAVHHARLVCEAVSSYNYHSFFQLYQNAPNMSAYFMDFMVDSIRERALKVMQTVYRPSLSILFIEKELGFMNYDECISFLIQHYCEIDIDQDILLTQK